MNFFDHKDLGNHLLQLCPKVVKHPVYIYNVRLLRVNTSSELRKSHKWYLPFFYLTNTVLSVPVRSLILIYCGRLVGCPPQARWNSDGKWQTMLSRLNDEPSGGSRLDFRPVHQLPWDIPGFLSHFRCGAVGWGTALQAGRSRFRFPMMKLKFFIDINILGALYPWSRLSL